MIAGGSGWYIAQKPRAAKTPAMPTMMTAMKATSAPPPQSAG